VKVTKAGDQGNTLELGQQGQVDRTQAAVWNALWQKESVGGRSQRS
jgi:hypothetical protein